MKFFFLLVIMLSLESSPSFASRVGNGGFVISCNGKVSLFDYYLAEQKGLHISSTLIAMPERSAAVNAQQFVRRLKDVDPNRGVNFHGIMDDYIRNTGYQMIPGNSLVLDANQVADPIYQEKFGLGPIQIPANCKLTLAIMQVEEPGRYMKLKIFSDVWNNLDLITQTGLLLHELFYSEHIRQQIPPFDSRGVRELNGLFSTDEFLGLTTADWNRELRKNSFLPMFPDFQVSSGAFTRPWIFWITTARDPAQFQFSRVASRLPDLVGQTSICGKAYETTVNGEVFFGGEVPEHSISRTDVSSMDLSCISKHKLVVAMTPNCPITYSQVYGVKDPVLNSLGAHPSMNRVCLITLQKYENPNVESVGPIHLVIENKRLHLWPSEFGILKAMSKGTMKNAKESVQVDLDTGDVISVDSFPAK